MTFEPLRPVINRVRHRGDPPDFRVPHLVASTTQALYFLSLVENFDEIDSFLTSQGLRLPTEDTVRGTYYHDRSGRPFLEFTSRTITLDVIVDRVVSGFAFSADAAAWYGIPRVRVNGVDCGDIERLVLERRRQRRA